MNFNIFQCQKCPPRNSAISRFSKKVLRKENLGVFYIYIHAQFSLFLQKISKKYKTKLLEKKNNFEKPTNVLKQNKLFKAM